MAKPQRVRIYIEATDQSAANAAFNTAIGNSNAFIITRVIASKNYYFVDLPVSDEQFGALTSAFAAIPTARIYKVNDSTNTKDGLLGAQYLRAVSTSTAAGQIGNLYNISHSDTDAGITISITEKPTVYVSPTGSSSGAGTQGDPVNLYSALIGIPNKATSEIILTAGTHNVASEVSTRIGSNITIRPETGLSWRDVKVEFEGVFRIYANNLTVRDLEITTNPTSRFAEDGKGTAPGLGGIDVNASDVSFINCRFHDLANFADQSTSPRSHYRECTFYNAGSRLSDGRTAGHQLYLQHGSYDGTNRKVIERCCFAHNIPPIGASNYSFHIYGSSDPSVILGGFDVNDCVFAYSTPWIGGRSPVYDLKLEGAELYRARLKFGYSLNDVLGDGGPVEVKNNYFHIEDRRPMEFIKPNENLSITGNIFAGNWDVVDVSQAVATPTIDNNDYYVMDSASQMFSYNGRRTFAELQGLGFEANGSATNGSPPDRVKFIPCTEGNNVAIVCIYNHNAQANTVTIDVSSFELSNGETYRLYSIFNLEEYEEFTYDGSGSVSVPMTGWTRADALGDGPDEPATHELSIKYMSFILEEA